MEDIAIIRKYKTNLVLGIVCCWISSLNAKEGLNTILRVEYMETSTELKA